MIGIVLCKIPIKVLPRPTGCRNPKSGASVTCRMVNETTKPPSKQPKDQCWIGFEARSGNVVVALRETKRFCAWAASLSLAALLFSHARAADWPMWRYDANRSAASPETLPKDLQLHWTRQYPARQQVWDDPLESRSCETRSLTGRAGNRLQGSTHRPRSLLISRPARKFGPYTARPSAYRRSDGMARSLHQRRWVPLLRQRR
jgi:hypothetical protein